jgi:hypothetical protein
MVQCECAVRRRSRRDDIRQCRRQANTGFAAGSIASADDGTVYMCSLHLTKAATRDSGKFWKFYSVAHREVWQLNQWKGRG